MTALFESAGLHDVRDWDVPIALQAESPEQYWLMLTELTAPVVAVLGQVDDAARERIATSVIDAARAFEVDGGVRLPGTARCVLGTKKASGSFERGAPLHQRRAVSDAGADEAQQCETEHAPSGETEEQRRGQRGADDVEVQAGAEHRRNQETGSVAQPAGRPAMHDLLSTRPR